MLAVFFLATAAAQSVFYNAWLNGEQSATTSKGWGNGFIDLKADGKFTADLAWQGLTGAPVAMHIHSGTPNGPPIFTLTNFTDATVGFIITLSFEATAQQVTDLNDGKWYFNIHTAANPGGEIRGNIAAKSGKATAEATLEAHVLPRFVNGSTCDAAAAHAKVLIDTSGTLIKVPDWTFEGLATNAVAAHVHGPAAQCGSAGILIPFAGVPAATTGRVPSTTVTVTSQQANFYRAGLTYIAIHTGAQFTVVAQGFALAGGPGAVMPTVCNPACA